MVEHAAIDRHAGTVQAAGEGKRAGVDCRRPGVGVATGQSERAEPVFGERALSGQGSGEGGVVGVGIPRGGATGEGEIIGNRE